jgi:hypothetical protein
MTKRFPSALASAVVTKKMINTPSRKVRPRCSRRSWCSPLPSAARGRCADTCLTWATGRAARTAQPESGRRSWRPPHPAPHYPADHPAPAQQLVLITVAAGAGLIVGVAVDLDVQRLPQDHLPIAAHTITVMIMAMVTHSAARPCGGGLGGLCCFGLLQLLTGLSFVMSSLARF